MSKWEVYIYWLVVSAPFKNISQIGNLPQIGVKIKNIWQHHPVYSRCKTLIFCLQFTKPSEWAAEASHLNKHSNEHKPTHQPTNHSKQPTNQHQPTIPSKQPTIPPNPTPTPTTHQKTPFSNQPTN